MVEGAVLALMFVAPDALALTLVVFTFVLMLALAAGPRAQLLEAITITATARTSIRTGGLTSVFFMLAFSEDSRTRATLID
jgi:hypothetical protein